MVKKVINTDFGGKTLDERVNESRERMLANVGFIKSHMRDDIASKIIVGICAGDWKFDTSFKSWDEMAAKRAYEIADAMIKEREITNV